MYTMAMIDEEVKDKVRWLEEQNGKELHKGWLINAVIQDHADIKGEDADFAICCARLAIRSRVESYFRKIKENENDPTDEQMIFPGFKRLQKRYIVERDELVAVSVLDMTDAEIKAKAEEHRRMGAGHFEHANELMQFLLDRAKYPTAV